MLPDTIMQSDLLDILFENRNKTYGAYAIRRSYNKTLLYATGITFFIATSFSFFQFMHHKKAEVLSGRLVYIPDNDLKAMDPPKEPELVENKPVEKKVSQKAYSAPVISDKIETTEMPMQEDLEKSMIGAKNIIGKDFDGTIPPPAETGTGKKEEIVAPEPVKEDKPLVKTQVMPEYPGGVEALKKFMLKNLRQPDDLRPGEKIIVRASFVVNKMGKIEQVKIISNGREDLDKEVIRVVNRMPLWKPGMQNGTTVSVYFNLPVTFLGAEE